jgi:hypothetical protein
VPDGKISINTNLAPFYVPLTNSSEDVVSLLHCLPLAHPLAPPCGSRCGCSSLAAQRLLSAPTIPISGRAAPASAPACTRPQQQGRPEQQQGALRSSRGG